MIREQPDSKSLVGVMEILTKYRINSLPLKISSMDLKNLTPPFVTQLIGDEEVVCVTFVKDTDIVFVNKRGKEIKQSLSNFLKKWCGVVLLIEKQEFSQEREHDHTKYQQYIDSLRVPTVITLSLLIITYFFVNNIGVFDVSEYALIGLFLLLLTGCMLSLSLITYSIEGDNSIVDKLCNIGSGSDCNRVLHSKGSKFLGIITWGEISFVFFSGYLLNIAFLPNALSLMFLFSITSLPYTVWSVFYQSRVAKSFCFLCILILIILWSAFFIHVFSNTPLQPPNLNTVLSSVSCFVFPSVVLYLFMPFVVESREVIPLKHTLHNLLTNRSIFDATLKTQPKFNIDNSLKQIAFGNLESPTTLTIITNPFCEPCARLHSELEGILSMYEDNICLRIIYAADTKNNEKNKIIKHLIAVYLQYDISEVKKIYAHWFSIGKEDPELFVKLFPVNIEDNEVLKLFNQHLKWCKNAEIAFTPILIMNNYKVPLWYTLNHIGHFVRY